MFFMCFGFDRLRRAFALVLGDRSRFWLLSYACGLFLSLVGIWFLSISYGGGGVLTMHSSRGRLRGLGDPSHYAE